MKLLLLFAMIRSRGYLSKFGFSERCHCKSPDYAIIDCKDGIHKPYRAFSAITGKAISLIWIVTILNQFSVRSKHSAYIPYLEMYHQNWKVQLTYARLFIPDMSPLFMQVLVIIDNGHGSTESQCLDQKMSKCNWPFWSAVPRPAITTTPPCGWHWQIR